MNVNQFAVKVANHEGNKKQVNIAQIKEVLAVANELTDGELYKIIKATTEQKTFKDYDKIKTKEGKFICVAVSNLAVFAPVKGKRTIMKDMFCVFPKYVIIDGKGNAEGFEFEFIK